MEYSAATYTLGGRGTPRHACSTRIKLLAVLRVLASACDFGFAYEVADISATCLERFFHRWLKWAANSGLFEKHVYLAEGEELTTP